MDQKNIKDILEKEKADIEKQLKNFAEKDPKLKGDWDTRFPKFNGNLDDAADEVTEYDAKLPVEYSLEVRLRDISLALDKLAKGKYGLCDNCQKKIEKERLAVYPAARLCLKCQKK
jgi:DnaK suppressor protein